MEQRRLRLGDTLDDYCPRERRVTNHAIVAMIEDDIKQTRCTTCDAEHVYKGAKVPRKRKKDAPSALYKEVLAGMPETDQAPVLSARNAAALPAEPDADAESELEPEAEIVVVTVEATSPLGEPAVVVEIEPEPAIATLPESPVEPVEEGPVHRPLIRATLPRPEGFVKEERRLPEFTIRQNGGRGGGNGNHFRGGSGGGGRPRGANGSQGNNDNRGNHAGNANRGHGAPRFSSRPGQPGRGAGGRGGGGQAAGFRGAPSRPGGGGRNKRSR